MHRPSRATCIFKWTGAVLSLALSFLSWGLAHWFCGRICSDPDVELGDGVFSVTWYDPPMGTDWDTSIFDVSQSTGEWGLVLPRLIPLTVQWGLSVDQVLGRSPLPPPTRASKLIFPLWIPAFLAAAVCAWLWHRDRRQIRPGYCPRCVYDLTGNTSGVCSECGLPAAAQENSVR